MNTSKIPVASTKAILGGKILTPRQIVLDGYLLIEHDRLTKIGKREELPPDCPVFDVSSYLITPGLIDLHIHGAVGHNVMGRGLMEVIGELPKHGVTSFLPTTLTTSQSAIHSALVEMAEIILQPPQGARPLGIHLEGPHLSRARAGMAIARYFHPLTVGEWDELQAMAKGTIKMLTFAPEEGEAMQLIPRLIREKVVPTIGHSDATFEQVSEMVELGLAHATHTFNAMNPFHHRRPGVIGAVLYYEQIVAQLIADLHHVHPAAMAILFKLKGPGKVALVSDAAPVAGLPDGEYVWDDETRVIIRDGTCRLPGGTLAGAASLVNQSLLNLTRQLGLSLQDALQAATTVPGEVLGVERGQLRPGWIADLVVWSEDFQPVATMVEGQWVWQQDSRLALN